MTQIKKSILMSAVDEVSPVTAKITESQKELETQLKETRATVSRTNKELGKVDQYNKANSAVLKAEAAHKRYSKQLDNQRKELQGLEKPTKTQLDRLAALEQKASDATRSLDEKSGALNSLERDLKAASIDTNNLGDEQERLARKSEKYTREAKEQGRALRGVTNQVNQLSKAQKAAAARRKDILSSAGGVVQGGVVAAGAGATASAMSGLNHQKSFMRVQNAADEAWTPETAKNMQQWALELQASRDGQGVSIQQIHKAMVSAIASGSTSQEDIAARVKTDLQVYSAFDKDRVDFDEITARMGDMRKMGASLEEIKSFAGAAAKISPDSYDPNDVFESYKEIYGATKASGLDEKALQAIYFSTSQTAGVKEGESVGIIESIADMVTKGGEVSKSEGEAYTMIGLDPKEAMKMAQGDLMGYVTMVMGRISSLSIDQQKTAMDGILGSENLKLLTALDPKNLAKFHNIAADDTGNISRLDARFNQSASTGVAGLDSVLGSLNRLAVILSEPLLEPLNNAADWTAEKINSLANWIDNLEDSTVKAGAGVAVFAGGVVAAGKVLTTFAALRGIVAKAGGVNASVNTTANTDANTSKKGSKLGKVANGLMVYSVVDAGMDAMIGDTGAGKWMKQTTLGDVWAGLTGLFSDKEIPTPEQYDKNAERVRTSNQTKTINVNVGGRVEGLTPEGEQQLINQITESTQQSIIEREGY